MAPVVPGHHRFADAGRLGSAVPARPPSRSAGGRGVLAGVSRDAQGVCPARGRAGPVAVAVRRDDVDSDRAARWHAAGRGSASVRIAPARRVDPLAAGLAVRDVRAEAIAASRGATDFGEYFVYFSFFLVVSALLLAALFFKLGMEQRAREVGLLRAVGFARRRGPPPVPGGGIPAGSRWQRARRRRRDWVCVAADGSPFVRGGSMPSARPRCRFTVAPASLASVQSAGLSRRWRASGGRFAVSTRISERAC